MLVFPDQNALIALGREARNSGFRTCVEAAIASGSLTIVVSAWNLVETANTSNLSKALELAEFIDSLKPAWLLERRDIQRLEVQDDFYRFLGLDATRVPRVTTRSAAFAALNNQKDAAKFDIASRDFVRRWVEHPEQLKALQDVYKKNADTLPKLREFVKQGKVTDDVRSRVNGMLLNGSLPATTPAGLDIGREVKTSYVAQADIYALPSLAIESAISEHEWTVTGGADRNTLIDKFHLIQALPYVDEVISDDHFFHRVYPVAAKTGHVRAKLVKNADFLARFAAGAISLS